MQGIRRSLEFLLQAQGRSLGPQFHGESSRNLSKVHDPGVEVDSQGGGASSNGSDLKSQTQSHMDEWEEVIGDLVAPVADCSTAVGMVGLGPAKRPQEQIEAWRKLEYELRNKLRVEKRLQKRFRVEQRTWAKQETTIDKQIEKRLAEVEGLETEQQNVEPHERRVLRLVEQDLQPVKEFLVAEPVNKGHERFWGKFITWVKEGGRTKGNGMDIQRACMSNNTAEWYVEFSSISDANEVLYKPIVHYVLPCTLMTELIVHGRVKEGIGTLSYREWLKNRSMDSSRGMLPLLLKGLGMFIVIGEILGRYGLATKMSLSDGSVMTWVVDMKLTTGLLLDDKLWVTPSFMEIGKYVAGWGCWLTLGDVNIHSWVFFKESGNDELKQVMIVVNIVSLKIIFETLLFKNVNERRDEVVVAKPHLHTFYLHGSTYSLAFTSMGSGFLAVIFAFESIYREGLTKKERIQLVAEPSCSDILNDLGSGSNVDVCVSHQLIGISFKRLCIGHKGQGSYAEGYENDNFVGSWAISGYEQNEDWGYGEAERVWLVVLYQHIWGG